MAIWRGAGIWAMLLFACGETTHGGEPGASGSRAIGGSATGGSGAGGSANSGNATGGNATGGNATGGNATGGNAVSHGGEGTTKPEPAAGMGGASAGAGSAGEGGGGACDGVEARCEPGEQACDPRLGKLGTCGACGVVTNVDEAGADCVRLLASDKESNGVCAVLGSDRLECFPDAFQVQKTKIAPDTSQVLLPDDYIPSAPYEPCFRDSSDRYSCLRDTCDGKVVVGDPGACGLCKGKVSCSDVPNVPSMVPQPIDISLTDGELIVLSPLGVHALTDAPQLPSGWRGSPAHLLVDHQRGGCVISDQQEMACWTLLSEGFQPARWKGDFKKVIGATLPLACALDGARQLRCGDVFNDEAPAPYGDTDTIDFVASTTLVCSLSAAGRVKCWDLATGGPRNVAPGW